jgi:hypothetical protein
MEIKVENNFLLISPSRGIRTAPAVVQTAHKDRIPKEIASDKQ